MRAYPSSVSKCLPRLVAVLLLAVALAGCNMVVLNPTGDIAVQQRDLILIATGLMLLIIVPVLVGGILGVLFRVLQAGADRVAAWIARPWLVTLIGTALWARKVAVLLDAGMTSMVG